MNFSPSASGCPRPNMCLSFSHGIIPNPSPTRLGPIRSCTHDAVLRSSKIRYATVPRMPRWQTRVIQNQGGMWVVIQFIVLEARRHGGTKARRGRNQFPFVPSCLCAFVPSSLQLHKLKRRLWRVLRRQLYSGEWLTHLGADVVGVVEAGFAEK